MCYKTIQLFTCISLLMLVGSLKKDQEVLTKNVEGLRKAIDDAVVKVKVQHHQSWPFGWLFCVLFIRFAEFLELLEFVSSIFTKLNRPFEREDKWSVCLEITYM